MYSEAEKPFFTKFIDLAIKTSPRKEWENEFIYYALFLTRSTLLASFVASGTKPKKIAKLINVYDYLTTNTLILHYQFYYGKDQTFVEKYLNTRISAYEDFFLNYPNKVFALVRSKNLFRWYLINHTSILPEGKSIMLPYDKNTYKPLMVDMDAFSENEAKVIDDFSEKVQNLLAKESEDLFKLLKKATRF